MDGLMETREVNRCVRWLKRLLEYVQTVWFSAVLRLVWIVSKIPGYKCQLTDLELDVS